MFKPAFAAVLVASCCTVAAEDSVEHISIYANRTATPQQDVLASVTVLERDDIIARQASDLPALLAQLPGISLARSGGRGQLSSVFVRGGETDHTLVLIDGVRSGSATAGAKSLATLPLELIERIEVIRGPRAALFGSDALAGVIAITTRRTDNLEATVNTGSYGQVGGDVSVTKKLDSLTLRASVGASRADGFNVQPEQDPDNDGYEQRFVKLAADYQTAVGVFTAQADVTSGSYEFDDAYGSDQDESDTLNRTYLLGWQYQSGNWQHQAQINRQLDSDTVHSATLRSPFVTERDEFNYQASTAVTDNLNILAGVNWYQESVDKSVTVYDSLSRTNRAVFTGVNYQLDKLTLEAAARRDDATEYGANNTWQLAAGYDITEQWQVRISRGTAFKAPTFNDMYYPGFANPDLKPEESESDEVALSYRSSGLNVQLAWFDRDITNLIQGLERAENVLLAKIEGVEFSIQQQWQQFSSNLAYTWLDTEDTSSGNMLLRRPENSINWRGSYDANQWSAFVTADYQSTTYQGADWYTGLDYPQAPSHTLWGLGVSYALSAELTLRAKVDNLFDKDYFTNYGYAAAGTNFGISLSYSPR